MQSWGRAIAAAVMFGTLISLHNPVDTLFTTISTPDVGLIAAELLLRPDRGEQGGVEILHTEGPQRYSADVIATALGKLPGREIHAEASPLVMRGDPGARDEPDSCRTPDQSQRCLGTGFKKVYMGTTTLSDALRQLLPLQRDRVVES